MANALLDQLRTYADQIDDLFRAADAELDQVEDLPFVSGLLKPIGVKVDSVLTIADNIRKVIDQFDPPAAAPAPVKK